MSKPSNICIFCENPGSSKEHIFGEWLYGVIARSEFRTEGPASNYQRGRMVVVREMKKVQGDLHTKKTKTVCRKCNNEWMSAVEKDAKAYLEPMILGTSVNLDAAARTKIAARAAITAITAEQEVASNRLIDQLHRTHVMMSRTPPMSWFVGVGFYVGTQQNDVWYIRDVSPNESTNDRASPLARSKFLACATYGLKHLIVHVIATDNLAVTEYLAANPLKNFSQLWPPTAEDIKWPPNVFHRLDDRNLERDIRYVKQNYNPVAGRFMDQR